MKVTIIDIFKYQLARDIRYYVNIYIIFKFRKVWRFPGYPFATTIRVPFGNSNQIHDMHKYLITNVGYQRLMWQWDFSITCDMIDVYFLRKKDAFIFALKF